MEAIALTDAFGVTGAALLPCLPLRFHVAQKLHGLALPPRPNKQNDRFRDLVDLLLMEGLVAHDYVALREACELVFRTRRTHPWPPDLAAMPSHWAEPFAQLAVELELPERNVELALVRVRAFVARILRSASQIPRIAIDRRLTVARQTRAQWALWLLFAHHHYNPTLNGIMFDFSHTKVPGQVDPGPGRLSPFFQRQGAAVFGRRIADNVPDGEKLPEAWKRRELFFAATHEIGHCFNLSHSWEKPAGNWMVDLGDPEADSFMNSPSHMLNVAGKDFYSAFGYRFDNWELAFMRYAPADFVEMGAGAAGKDRGLVAAGRLGGNSGLALEIALARPN